MRVLFLEDALSQMNAVKIHYRHPPLQHVRGHSLKQPRRYPCVRAGHLKEWSEREDLNLRPPVPQTGALTGLRYAPFPAL